MEMSGQLHISAALTSGKDRPMLIQYEAGWAPDTVWTWLLLKLYLEEERGHKSSRREKHNC
jgi:hypothetical protein